MKRYLDKVDCHTTKIPEEEVYRETMKALSCSNPAVTYLPDPSLFISRTPILRQSPRLQAQIGHPTAWKLRANPKGFSPTAGGGEAPRRKVARKSNEEDPDEPIPQIVFERMMVRILVSVGLPLGTGVAILKFLGFVKEQGIWDVPLWVPFLSTLVTFGASALGIAYGSISTSLDPEKRGSVLGIAEARHNWVEMWKEEDGN